MRTKNFLTSPLVDYVNYRLHNQPKDVIGMHPLSKSYIQSSYLKQYESLADELGIKDKTRVLDIGSGLGYFKYITDKRGGLYLGLENNKQVYMLAKKLYGDDGFINESFPVDKIYNKKFDIIIALSCLDEICKKEIFLECVKKIQYYI